MKRKLLVAGMLTTASLIAVSCGGGSNSASSSGDASLAKTAVLEISAPALSEKLQSQLISEDTTSIRVEIVQLSADSNGVVCDLKTKRIDECAFYKTSVKLTPSTPTAKVNLYPALTYICFYQSESENSQPTLCSIAELQPGQNDLKYTLVRGTWSLPQGENIGGFTKIAISGYEGRSNGMNLSYQNPLAYLIEPILSAIGSTDGTTWNLDNRIGGIYTQVNTPSSVTSAFIIGKGSDGFAALQGNFPVKYTEIRHIYTWNWDYGFYSWEEKLVKTDNLLSVKIYDKNGNDKTSDILNTCKLSTTDGKSMQGCLVKNLTEGTQDDYTYKIERTLKFIGANICYDDNSLYDPSTNSCYNLWYDDMNNCYWDNYTFNSNRNRCEATLQQVCEGNEGTYNSTNKSCEYTDTLYVKLDNIKSITITGSPSFPSTGNISVQRK